MKLKQCVGCVTRTVINCACDGLSTTNMFTQHPQSTFIVYLLNKYSNETKKEFQLFPDTCIFN